MGSYNHIVIAGNLVRDPEIRYVGSGAAVCKVTLAVNRRTKDKEEVDFIDCVFWEKLAETVNTYLKKGSNILVEGRLSIRSYEDKEGVKRKSAEVVARGMQMFGKKQDDALDGGYERPAGGYGAPAGGYQASAGASDEGFLDEEIPF